MLLRAFRITLNDADGALIAVLEAVGGIAGRFRVPREKLEHLGTKPFHLHISIEDPYYGICSLKAL